MFEALRDRFHDIRLCQHADFGGINANIAEHRVQLGTDKIRFDTIHRLHAARILRHQCGNDRAAIRPKGGEGFQIRLNPGATTRISASNG
ncbi:hypothetical protein D3C72_2349580 [compost metagenome]